MIPIYAEACGNTFLLFDCLTEKKINKLLFLEVHRLLIKEGKDDAIILVDGRCKEKYFYFRMLVLGVDGTFGEFCGNGARCCAAYLYQKYPGCQIFFLGTPKGEHPLFSNGEGKYSILLPHPSLALNKKFIKEKAHPFTYVEVLEPHLVIQKILSDEELLLLGKSINAQKEKFPLGININAWHPLSNGALFVKTYERGVQRLTKSCGSGSVACAAAYCQRETIRVINPGGELDVSFCPEGVLLKGPAELKLHGYDCRRVSFC